MPAAAVTPAPIAYINVVALKKLVVRLSRAPLTSGTGGASSPPFMPAGSPSWTPPDHCEPPALHGQARLVRVRSCEQIRVFQAGIRLAWLSME